MDLRGWLRSLSSPATLRHRPRRNGIGRLAQEAEGAGDLIFSAYQLRQLGDVRAAIRRALLRPRVPNLRILLAASFECQRRLD